MFIITKYTEKDDQLESIEVKAGMIRNFKFIMNSIEKPAKLIAWDDQ